MKVEKKEKRKHAELIHAWADDKSLCIEYKNSIGWNKAETPSWSDDTEYRIKPKTVKFRNYLDIDNKVKVTTDISLVPRKWIGDWQEVEI